jgi:hypothetical protein
MKYTQRKIWSGVTLLIVGVVITFIKGDIPPNLLSLMELLYSAFVIGNFGQHAAETYRDINKEDKNGI